MKHKVSDLTGPQLDAAVAMAQGWKRARVHDHLGQPWDHDSWCEGGDDANHAMHNADGPHAFAPSTAWSDGGPVIEREFIAIYRLSERTDLRSPQWIAGFRLHADGGRIEMIGKDDWHQDDPLVGMDHWQVGHTPLIAACRAFVASKFGKEIEI